MVSRYRRKGELPLGRAASSPPVPARISSIAGFASALSRGSMATASWRSADALLATATKKEEKEKEQEQEKKNEKEEEEEKGTGAGSGLLKD